MTNQEYTLRRNELIPEAEAYANSTVGKIRKEDEWKSALVPRWNHTFHVKMHALARAAGLVK